MTSGRLHRATLIALGALLAACGGKEGDGRSTDPPPAPSAPASATATAAPQALVDPNPFKLPPRALKLDKGGRVFTVPEPVLAGARLGSTLILQSATVVGFDGDLLVIENKSGPSYKIHPAYAIAVPDSAGIRPNEPIVLDHHGVLRHAVVRKLLKDRATVRFTGGDTRTVELLLKNARVLRQVDGLRPGNFAALGDGETLRHVLLVSSFEDAGDRKWLVLGAGGAAMIVAEAALEAIPVKMSLRAGATVLAEHNGVLRKATLTAAPEQGIFTVKYERAGRPVTLGWGYVMPLTAPRPAAR